MCVERVCRVCVRGCVYGACVYGVCVGWCVRDGVYEGVSRMCGVCVCSGGCV